MVDRDPGEKEDASGPGGLWILSAELKLQCRQKEATGILLVRKSLFLEKYQKYVYEEQSLGTNCSSTQIFTCVPNILDPDVGAGCEEQPMNRDEQKANHVGRDGNANEEYWECLQEPKLVWSRYVKQP